MPTVVNGLPAHVLLVHFAVVLIPATALLLILAVVWPAARERIGVFGPLLALVTVVFVQVTANAGTWFQAEIGTFPALDEHAALGATMIWWSLGALVAFVAWWLISSTTGQRLLIKSAPVHRIATNKIVLAVVGVIAVVVAAGSLWHGFQVGDTGAKAVWDGVVS